MITHGTKETTRPADAAARKKRPLQEAPLARGSLTAREQEVWLARLRGLTTKQIAHELRISESTVRVIVWRSVAKLRIRNPGGQL